MSKKQREKVEGEANLIKAGGLAAVNGYATTSPPAGGAEYSVVPQHSPPLATHSNSYLT